MQIRTTVCTCVMRVLAYVYRIWMAFISMLLSTTMSGRQQMMYTEIPTRGLILRFQTYTIFTSEQELSHLLLPPH